MARGFNRERVEGMYRYLVSHIEQYGYQPTVVEMARAVGAQPNTVNKWINLLESEGRILRPPYNRERCFLIPGLKFEPYRALGKAEPHSPELLALHEEKQERKRRR